MLLLKLLLVPALIWLITAAARKWGPSVAGALAGFPVITGSILLILTLEQGPDFARQAALASALGAAANVVFGIAYSWAALRWRWPPCLTLGVAGYALAVAASRQAAAMPWLAAWLALAFLPLAGRLFPSPPAVAPRGAPREAGMAPRIAAGALLVLIITSVSDRLGPSLSGVLAVFPVLASVLGVFTHASAGPAAAIRLLRGMVRGFYAFIAFCLALAATLDALRPASAFLLALSLAVLVQLAGMWLGRHRH
ncbi:hypothetical protein J9978_16345 [Chromobacterium violaceum]|uniref:hypothetical protein n=1 Tax=Chromobacterium violaceum TaxID=536 RepID=UPI001B3305D0|nr:hypothetical protein [Chromobacterium violaceum]MBP4051053.1 hypothetical protein [Chromobacterium violaceum]